MAKKPSRHQDQFLIAQYKEVARLKQRLADETKNNIPELYACICKVLIDEYGWYADDVADLFYKTQEAWQNLIDQEEVKNMVEWCEMATGVSLRSEDGNKDEDIDCV